MPERGMEGVIRGGVPGGVSNAAKTKAGDVFHHDHSLAVGRLMRTAVHILKLTAVHQPSTSK